jgi:predicted transcriptional regulator
MANSRGLGTLERAIMDQLWDNSGPQTVRQVHRALSAQRDLAYSTVMTVLQRLTGKSLVTQIRSDRAYQYAPNRRCEELVADLMVDALHQASGTTGRRAALLQFVNRVAAEDAETLRRGLA